jgi:predicted CopG family antitoxin
MSRTLTISDSLYDRLQQEAAKRGFDNIPALLEVLQQDFEKRAEVVQQIDALREQLFEKYGQMPDSAALIEDDRAR